MYLGIHRFTQIRSFSHEKYEKEIDIILPFRFFLIVRTIVPPSSIDSDQVIDRNTQNQKKKKIYLRWKKRKPVVVVVWSLRQTGKNDVEYCITFMLFFESATSE